MKHTYIGLLLTTTFVIGCCGGKFKGNIEAANPSPPPGRDTSNGGDLNQPSWGFNASSILSAFNYFPLVDKVKNVDELLALPEVKSHIKSLELAWEPFYQIQNEADITPAYIKTHYEVEAGLRMWVDAITRVETKWAEAQVSLTFSGNETVG